MSKYFRPFVSLAAQRIWKLTATEEIRKSGRNFTSSAVVFSRLACGNLVGKSSVMIKERRRGGLSGAYRWGNTSLLLRVIETSVCGRAN